ncbi:hypothetical protein PVAP13_5KG448707 [Panicum virgatum]|uniref:Uncharacterized protein n=1 Tax=Panicum virgatum TaxID=38727 RepID=A0A8T0SQT3_PANVG|nr:hypothetical protein PVAP13_5KG448707 [Panicum virgatum]
MESFAHSSSRMVAAGAPTRHGPTVPVVGDSQLEQRNDTPFSSLAEAPVWPPFTVATSSSHGITTARGKGSPDPEALLSPHHFLKTTMPFAASFRPLSSVQISWWTKRPDLLSCRGDSQ